MSIAQVRSKERGVSLIELVIAMSIASIVVLTGVEMNRTVLQLYETNSNFPDLMQFQSVLTGALSSKAKIQDFGECDNTNLEVSGGAITNGSLVRIKTPMGLLAEKGQFYRFKWEKYGTAAIKNEAGDNDSVDKVFDTIHIESSKLQNVQKIGERRYRGELEYNVIYDAKKISGKLKKTIRLPILFQTVTQFGDEYFQCASIPNQDTEVACESLGAEEKEFVDNRIDSKDENGNWLISKYQQMTSKCKAKAVDSCAQMSGVMDAAGNCDFCLALGGTWVGTVCSVLPSSLPPEERRDMTPPPSNGLAWKKTHEQIDWANNTLPECNDYLSRRCESAGTTMLCMRGKFDNRWMMTLTCESTP